MVRMLARTLTLGGIISAPLFLGLAPAAAEPPPWQPQDRGLVNNPDYPINPFAVPKAGPGGACVLTFKAPPADGQDPAGSDSAGGNPGWVYTGSQGNHQCQL
jgi:hypothetical protein